MHTALTTESFLLCLSDLYKRAWIAWLTSRQGVILMKRKGSSTHFSPLTAVYFYLTGKEIDRGSYWVEELTHEFGLPWYEVLELSSAVLACDLARRYDRKLRKRILEILWLEDK